MTIKPLDLLSLVLRPVVRLMLRHGMGFWEFSRVAKRLYVDVAEQDFPLEGRKQTTARIAMLTGLNRKDVTALRNEPMIQSVALSKANRAQRIVSAWLRDPDFLDDEGSPLPLATDQEGQAFDMLIKRYSGDLPARTICDELLRVGAVQRLPDGRLALSEQGYVPHEDAEQMLKLYATSACDLLETMDYNLTHPARQSRLQLMVSEQQVTDALRQRFRRLSRDKALRLLRKLDRELSQSLTEMEQSEDDDTTDDDRQRYRVGLGIYYFENVQEKDD